MINIIGTRNNKKDVDVVAVDKVEYLIAAVRVCAQQAVQPFAYLGAVYWGFFSQLVVNQSLALAYYPTQPAFCFLVIHMQIV